MAVTGKTLPNSLEAEQGILSCILLDNQVPMEAFPLLKPDDFYSIAHQTIYSSMQELYQVGKPVDLITLVDNLENKGKLEAVGGLEYVSQLTNFLPGATNFKNYIEIIKNHSRRRKLIRISQAIAETSFENEDGNFALKSAENQIFKIGEEERTSSLEHIESSLNEVIERFDFFAKNGGAIRGLPTGFNDLDQITGGLQKSDLIVLAARPGVGKTSFAMNIVSNAAIKHGKSCAVFSLEMPCVQIAQRAICSTACVSLTKALNGNLNEEDWLKIWKAKKDLGEAKIYIENNGMNTPSDIMSKCQRLKMEHGLDLVMIDYLQLMKSGTTSLSAKQSRTLEIGEITRFFKMMALELNVPVLLLSQLSRDVEKRDDHKPMASDLRDSGTIEQDADIIMFLYNPAKYNDVVIENGQEGIVELELAKHRNGSTGTIKLRWIGEWVKFVGVSEGKSINITTEPKKQTESAPEEIMNSADLDEIFADAPTEDAPPPTDAPPEEF